MNTNIVNQQPPLYPQLSFSNAASCFSYWPLSPQPLYPKRFVADNGESKPGIAAEKPVEVKIQEKMAGKRKAYFNITKSEGAKDKKAIRAEKNRMFAKESRDRKQMYIRNIENQLRVLRVQVEDYKQRLSKYELIEEQLELNHEIKKYMESVRAMLAETKEAPVKNQAFVSAMQKFYTEAIREKQKALSILTKAMVEMMMPLSVRLCLWTKEKGVDLHNNEEVEKLVQEKVPNEQAQNVKEYVKIIQDIDRLPNGEVKYVTDAGLRVRELIRKMVKCQKKAQIELAKICDYMNKSMFPNFDLVNINNFVRITAQLILSPELSNYSLCKLGDSDFTISEEVELKKRV